MMIAIGEYSRCLRREYLGNKEKVAPQPLNRGDFFFVYGQRLSSLYRKSNLRLTWLIKSVQTGFSFSKILNSNAYQKELS